MNVSIIDVNKKIMQINDNIIKINNDINLIKDEIKTIDWRCHNCFNVCDTVNNKIIWINKIINENNMCESWKKIKDMRKDLNGVMNIINNINKQKFNSKDIENMMNIINDIKIKNALLEKQYELFSVLLNKINDRLNLIEIKCNIIV